MITSKVVLFIFTLIHRTCDESLAPTIKSVIYAAGRVDIPELLRIKEQLLAKYGKEWADQAAEGADPKLVLKLGIRNPDAMLVNRYLAAIAESYSIPWAPLEEDVLIDMSGPVSPSGPTGLPQQPAISPAADLPPPPPYSSAVRKASSPALSQAQAQVRAPTPDLPSVPLNRPSSSTPADGSGESGGLPDFDELARRFEALKNNSKPKQ